MVEKYSLNLTNDVLKYFCEITPINYQLSEVINFWSSSLHIQYCFKCDTFKNILNDSFNSLSKLLVSVAICNRQSLFCSKFKYMHTYL